MPRFGLTASEYATLARLTTPEGKSDLKKAITTRTTESDEQLKVDDVLFSEFIVQ